MTHTVTTPQVGELQIPNSRRPNVPLERMLIETDSPYLAPVPHRGKRNQPAWVRHVAEEIAVLRDVPVAAIAAATSDNFFNLFGVSRNAH